MCSSVGGACGVGQECVERAGGGGKGSAAVYDGEFGPETLALDDSWSRQRRCVGAIAAPHTAHRASPKGEEHPLAGVQEGVCTPRSAARFRERERSAAEGADRAEASLTAQSTRRNGGMSAAVRAPDAPTYGTTQCKLECARRSAESPRATALVRGRDRADVIASTNFSGIDLPCNMCGFSRYRWAARRRAGIAHRATWQNGLPHGAARLQRGAA